MIEILVNYGLAGIVVYMFYKLLNKNITYLTRKIDELTKTITELNTKLTILIDNMKNPRIPINTD